MDKISSQKILLKDYLYFDHSRFYEEQPKLDQQNNSNNNNINKYPYPIKKKQQSKTKKNNEKENNNSRYQDIMKVNSLAMAKKGSFKVSYLEDFTIEFDKHPYNNTSINYSINNNINQQKNDMPQITTNTTNTPQHIAQNLQPKISSKMQGLKKLFHQQQSSRNSNYNDSINKIKTNHSSNSILPNYIKESRNHQLNSIEIDTSNTPSLPIYLQNNKSNNNNNNGFSQNITINNSNNNNNLCDTPNNNIQNINNQVIFQISTPKQQLQQQINNKSDQNYKDIEIIKTYYKKNNSLPPLKSKQNTTPINPSHQPHYQQQQHQNEIIQPSINQNNSKSTIYLQNQMKSQHKKRYSYLFDSYTKVQDKVIQTIDDPLILQTEPDNNLNIQKIFKINQLTLQQQQQQQQLQSSHNNNKFIDQFQQQDKKNYTNALFLKNTYKTPKNNNNTVYNKMNISTNNLSPTFSYSNQLQNQQSLLQQQQNIIPLQKYSDLQCIPFKSYVSPLKTTIKNSL